MSGDEGVRPPVGPGHTQEPTGEIDSTPAGSKFRLGSYEVEEEIGRGGMGVVYRSRDTALGRTVAVKALTEDLARSPQSLARLEREARLLASVSHPNVATIYALEKRDGRPYLILEYIAGESLAARLGRGSLPLADLRAALGDERLAALLAEGRSLDIEQASALALGPPTD